MKNKYILLFGLILTISIFLPLKNTKAQEGGEEGTQKIEYILFHLETCPHCRDEIKFLNTKLLPKYGEYIDLKMYEVSDKKNSDIFRQYGAYYNVEVGSVPMTIIDGEIVTGYGTDKTTGAQIMSIVEKKLKEKGVVIEVTVETDNNKLSMALIIGSTILVIIIILIFKIKKNNKSIL